jgi:hypothetical protein
VETEFVTAVREIAHVHSVNQTIGVVRRDLCTKKCRNASTSTISRAPLSDVTVVASHVSPTLYMRGTSLMPFAGFTGGDEPF